MAKGISIKNDEVVALARRLASEHGKGLTEIVHEALRDEAERDASEPTLCEKLAPMHARLATMGRTGPPSATAMGAGRPGILNLGDCFSYATAKHLGAPLLFKGDDSGRTDIVAA